MSQPLVGEVCPEDQQGGFMFRCWFCFYGSGLAALLLISWLLYIDTTIWMLLAVVVTGAIFGLISAGFIRRIRESGEIMHSARKPMLAAVIQACRNGDIIRQMISGMSCNALTIMIVPISMLTLKRGCGVSDSSALLYSLVQFGSSTLVCGLLGRIADRFGGRKVTVGGFCTLALIPVFWLFAPSEFRWYWFLIPFLLCPAGTVVTVVGLQQYFLRTIPKDQQIAASMVISVATGVVSGIIGSLLSTTLLKLASVISGEVSGLSVYKWYFAGVLILLPVFGVLTCLLRKETLISVPKGKN